MRKLTVVFLAALLLLGLASCGESTQAAGKVPGGGSGSVSEILENAGGAQEPALPTAEPAPPAEPPAPTGEPPAPADGIDVDLTSMSSTMVFAEVSNMMYMPDDYIGKVVRMRGTAVSMTDPQTGVTYHAVIIQDATACCASGIDYLLVGEAAYPPDETEVTVTGEFELYEDGDAIYARLKDACLSE